MIQFLDLYKQYQSIKTEIDVALQAVIDNSAFVGGPFLTQFEMHFAQYQQAAHCIGVGNGTDALEIAIEALDLPQGSEIIVPGNSFIASAEAVTRTGHQVVFCDVNQKDYTVQITDVSRRINKNTSAIIAVHLYGHPCDMKPLLELAQKHHLKMIEDCAQAHGAEYYGRRVGTLGDIGTFSFYPGKNLGAYGDGGAIVTNDPELALKCQMIADHGRIKKYDHEFEGRNSRLDGLQAAILEVKLKHLENWISKRNQIAQLYTQHLKDHRKIKIPIQQPHVRHSYHLYVIRTPKRDELQKYLTEHQIQTGIHYPISLPQSKAYQYVHQAHEKMFVNQIGSELLSLPIGEHLTITEVNTIISALWDFKY